MFNDKKESTKQGFIQQQTPSPQVLPDNYAVMSNVYSQIIAALNNLRERCYDVLDASYETGHLLNDQPEFIDTLLDRIVNISHGLEYGFHRYNLAIPKDQPDEMLASTMSAFFRSIDGLIVSSDATEYKTACEQLQKCGDGVTSIIAMRLQDFQSKLKDLEIDIQVGPHTDTMADLFPDRFESIINSSESNRKSLSIKVSQKASNLDSTIDNVRRLDKALRVSKNTIDIFQSKQSVLVKQIQMFAEREDRDQVTKLKLALKQTTNDFLTKIEQDWMSINSIWGDIDIPSSPVNDIDPDNARHIRRALMSPLPDRTESIISIYRDIRKWTEGLVTSLTDTKRSGGLPDKRSKWYIGNKAVVDEFNNFKKQLEQDAMDSAAHNKYASDKSSALVIAKLSQYIDRLTKFVSREMALDLGRGEKWVRESMMKAGLIWTQIDALHSAYKKSEQSLGNTKAFNKTFDTYRDMFKRLNTATDDQERFAEIKRMTDITPQLISELTAIEVSDSDSSDSYDPSRLNLLQVTWNDLARKYSEMLQLVPNNTLMQLDHLMNDVPEAGKQFNKRIDAWLRTAIMLVEKVIEFSVFYIRIKSLYPLTIGMRTNVEPGIDYRGRSVENIKYVESMGALLHEALSGKSLSASKTALLRQSLELYPDDQKVIVANKMYDLAIKGY